MSDCTHCEADELAALAARVRRLEDWCQEQDDQQSEVKAELAGLKIDKVEAETQAWELKVKHRKIDELLAAAVQLARGEDLPETTEQVKVLYDEAAQEAE